MDARARIDLSEVAATLGLGDTGRPPRIRRKLALVAVAVAIAAIALGARSLAVAPRDRFATEAVRRGDFTVTATATGTLQPIDQVDIGSELSGTIRSVEVGYNDAVQAGQVLARLDTTRLEAQVLQSKATLAAAQASVDQARANRGEAESQLSRLEHVKKLSGGKVPSDQELVSARSALTRSGAALESAQAAVQQAEATLAVEQSDLSKATIRSPIDGIVLMAAARPGQTVAASLQAPLLFTLANDLARLQLDLGVDEADVGQVKEGQTATFTVDAWPGRTFSARVSQVRYAARALGGVVSYETILAVENPDLALRPGMTATATIEVRHDPQALLVPNAALRFDPADARPGRGPALGGLIPNAGQFEVGSGDGEAAPHVWVARGGKLARVPVEIGATDGSWTELVGGSLEPGTKLAVGASARRG
jgi:HlyD family secretion protein